MSEITPRQHITDILAKAGVKATFKHVPTEFDPKSKDWQHIAWNVVIESPRGKFTTDYKQGIGHLPNYPKSGKLTTDTVNLIKFTLRTGLVKTRPGMFMAQGKPLPVPDAVDVVSSLISDASAADYARFEEWANDMGMNPDSIKDQKVWEACREIALQLNRVIGCNVVELLRDPCSQL